MRTLDSRVFIGQPACMKYAMVTPDGIAWLTDRYPSRHDHEWTLPGSCKMHYLGDDFYAEDWENSLIEREELMENKMPKIEPGDVIKIRDVDGTSEYWFAVIGRKGTPDVLDFYRIVPESAVLEKR